MTDPLSEADFALARRAVERGWLTQNQVESALVSYDRTRGTRLLAHLPLTPEQVRELEGPGRPVPPEASAAMKDPSNRVGRCFWKINHLKSGGMGAVWRGWDSELHRWVALKFLKAIGDETAHAYFRREAQLAAGLDHPNIAKVYEVGEHEGLPYIAMQFIDGTTLGEAKLGLEGKLAAVGKVAEAVRTAHGKGVIHRDLKPGNVMVDREGCVYVMDFGLAKQTDVDVTGTAILGTPSYMAPEQARGKADAQSDLYGIGAILYELLTGRPPFTGESAGEVLEQVLSRELVWPRKLSPATPRDIEAIILHALEKDGKRRYETPGQLIEDLDHYERHRPLKYARRPTLGYVLGKMFRRQPVLWLALAGLAFAIVAGAAFGTTQLLRAKREARRAADETVRRASQEREAARRESGLQRLTTLWLTVVEKKQELRSARAPAQRAREELRQAVDDVGTYIAAWPAQAQGYYVRGRGWLYLGDLDAAERDVREAIQREPRFCPGWTFLGIVIIERCQESFVGDPATFDARLKQAERFLKEAREAFSRGWESGKEQEEAARWGLAWSREDRVALRVAQALQAAFLDGDFARTDHILEEGIAEFRAEEYLTEYALSTFGAATQVEMLTQAIDLAPGYERAWFFRGLAKRQLGDLDGAIADYTRAIDLRPDFAGAYINRGFARGRKGDLHGAIADADRAIRFRPAFAEAYDNRGLHKYLKGDLDGAIADCTHAIELNPELPQPYNNRALAKKGKGDLRGALADCDRALALNEAFAEAFVTSGEVKQALGDLNGALSDAERVIESGDPTGKGHLLRGCIRIDRSDWDGAIADFSRAIEWKVDQAKAYALRANAKRGKRDMAGALADFDRAIEIRKDEPMLYRGRGSARQADGDVEGAMADFNRALELDKNDASAYADRAVLERETGRPKEALADFNKAIELGGGSADTYTNRALARFDLGDLDEATADCDRALTIDKEHANAYNTRGLVRDKQGDDSSALADFNRAIELRKDFALAHYNRALIKQHLEDYAGALADYDRAVELRPGFALAYANRGNVKYVTGDLLGAIGDYDHALEYNSDLVGVVLNRGIARMDLKQFEAAIADFDRVLAVRKSDANVHFRRALARRGNGDSKGALVDFDRAIELAAESPDLYYERAVTKGELGDRDGAIADLDHVLSLRKDDVMAYLCRALMKHDAGDVAGAIADLEKALEVAPEDRRDGIRKAIEKYRRSQ